MSAGDFKDMFTAACDGDLELVRHHLAQRVDPDHVHPEVQSTALVASILAGHEDVARVLLEHGTDPGLASPLEAQTPLDAARERGMVGLVADLAQHSSPSSGTSPSIM